MPLPMPLRGALALAFLAALSGCDLVEPSAGDDARSDLEAARALWQAARIPDYELTLERFCFCPSVGPVVVRVEGGFTTSVVPEDGEVDDPLLLTGYPDVEGLFGVVDQALARRAHRLRVAYHPTLGYPTEISVDYRENVADEEVGYVASLQVLRDEG